jgi:hypothetical protein
MNMRTTLLSATAALALLAGPAWAEEMKNTQKNDPTLSGSSSSSTTLPGAGSSSSGSVTTNPAPNASGSSSTTLGPADSSTSTSTGSAPPSSSIDDRLKEGQDKK